MPSLILRLSKAAGEFTHTVGDPWADSAVPLQKGRSQGPGLQGRASSCPTAASSGEQHVAPRQHPLLHAEVGINP